MIIHAYSVSPERERSFSACTCMPGYKTVKVYAYKTLRIRAAKLVHDGHKCNM